MKILVLAGNAYLPVAPFDKSKNGFGYTVGSFCQNIAHNHEVYLLTQSAFTEGKTCEGINIVKKTGLDILSNASLRYVELWWKETKDIPLLSRSKFRTLFYYLTGPYVEKVIRDLKPDIINIRGVHIPTSSFMAACRNTGIPMIVSLHGLNSFSDELNSGKTSIMLERKFLQEINDNPVTVISSGIKRKIESFVGRELPNIRVVLNGIKCICKEDYVDEALMKSLGIPAGSNVLISVSSINRNKNQIQVLEAIHMMPETLRENTYYLVCGVGDYEAKLLDKAAELGIEKNLKLCGYIKNTDMWRYYSISDVNMMVSYSEGFGRSVIEGYMCGVPAVMYSDLDACEDITDPCTAVIVKNRSTEALLKGIIEALNTDWDADKIIEYSKQFTDIEMANQYIAFFEEVIKNI